MNWLLDNPLLLWLSIGGVLLAVEVATTSGWLLWPTGAAVVTAGFAWLFAPGLPVQLVVFALLTIATTLLGRRFFPKAGTDGADINDTTSRLRGNEGVVAQDFTAGSGRVLVDGKEWAAALEGGGALSRGAKIVVTDVGGARLTVRAV
jgi:membrane protein implicated in regulation of membrane protease activity